MALSQRKNCRWHLLEMKLHHVEEKWENCLEEVEEEIYSCDGELDPTIEKKSHSNLIVSGPMFDVYLKELGQVLFSRLSKRKGTGIQQTSAILPWQVYVNIIKLIRCYGGKTAAKLKKNKEKNISLKVSTQSCTRKVWNTKRRGRDFLSKIKLSKSLSPKDYEYAGCSKVVVTCHTPLGFYDILHTTV